MLLCSCVNEAPGLCSALRHLLVPAQGFQQHFRLKTWAAVIHRAGKKGQKSCCKFVKSFCLCSDHSAPGAARALSWGLQGCAGGWAFPAPTEKPNLRKLLYTRYFLLMLLQNCLILIIRLVSPKPRELLLSSQKTLGIECNAAWK